MAPKDYYTDEEINEIIFKIGDVIESVHLQDVDSYKVLPDNMKTAWLMLETAHSMLADAHPTDQEEQL